MRVLLVEDQVELAQTIAGVLRRDGMAVDLAFDGEQALERAAVSRYDVIVLDRDLPVVHGDDVCRTLIADGSQSRVLMLTAAGGLEERVGGLGLGADDYLPKPFAFVELVARIRALARRGGTPYPADPCQRRSACRLSATHRRPRWSSTHTEPKGTRCP